MFLDFYQQNQRDTIMKYHHIIAIFHLNIPLVLMASKPGQSNLLPPSLDGSDLATVFVSPQFKPIPTRKTSTRFTFNASSNSAPQPTQPTNQTKGIAAQPQQQNEKNAQKETPLEIQPYTTTGDSEDAQISNNEQKACCACCLPMCCFFRRNKKDKQKKLANSLSMTSLLGSEKK